MKVFFVLLSILLSCFCVQGGVVGFNRSSNATGSPLAVDIIYSGWADVAPSVDGVASEEEWSASTVIVLSGFDRLYVMNNRSHLFFRYVVWDRGRFHKDSALFLDPDGDGFYNYAYGYSRVFMVFPLFGGVVGDGGGIYCGNPQFGVSDLNCGEPFRSIREKYWIGYSRSPTSITSEVSIPLKRQSYTSNGRVFLWFLYGSPSPLCFPETLQCFRNPVFAELRLAEGPEDAGQTIYEGDSIGLFDYYDIKPYAEIDR